MTEDAKMKKYFDYLDRLRDSGVTNMFGAAAYLQRDFIELGFDPNRAKAVLAAWMSARSGER